MAKVKKGQVVYTRRKVYREGDIVPDELLKDPPKDPPKDPGKSGQKGK